MEVETTSHAGISSFEHLDELARYVDLDFILSNTTSTDSVRFFSLDDLTDSLGVLPPSPQPSLSSSVETLESEEVEAIENYLKAEFLEVLQVKLAVETEPFISSQDMKYMMDSCLEMLSTSQNSTVTNPLLQVDMDSHTVPNGYVAQEVFIQPPVFNPAPPPLLAPPPPHQYQFQTEDMNMQFCPQQQMFNEPPPMQPQQHYLHPEQTMPPTPPPSCPENMDTSDVKSKKKKMKKKHLQEKGGRKLVGQKFTCSFPGCSKVYVKRGHYMNHLEIHPAPVDENHSVSRWGGYGQQCPRFTEAPGRHQQYPGTF